MSISSKQELGYVAIFDVLGFKNLIDEKGLEGAYGVLNNLMHGLSTYGSMINPSNFQEGFKTYAFSDTIVATCPDHGFQSFKDIASWYEAFTIPSCSLLFESMSITMYLIFRVSILFDWSMV